MSNYQAKADPNLFIRTVDGAVVPRGQPTGSSQALEAWLAAGNTPDPYVPIAPPSSFVARDLLALFTPADYAALQSAVASSAAMGLLWYSLLAQGDAPIFVTSDRFKAGWAALSTSLGATRAAAIAVALNIT